MTDLALIAQDPSALELSGDAGEFVVLACERAKSWLTQAIDRGDIDSIVETKSQADAIRVYTRQKELGKDAELAATEIVRRAERGLGMAIRNGQEAGTFRKKGQHDTVANQYGSAPPLQEKRSSPGDYFRGGLEQDEVYKLTDGVSDEEFDAAIEEAKAEGNLTRRHLVRKVKGTSSKMTKAQKVARISELAGTSMSTKAIAAEVGLTEGLVRAYAREAGVTLHTDAVVGKVQRLNPDRVVGAIVDRCQFDIANDTVLAAIELTSCNPAYIDEWVSSLTVSIKSLTTLRKRLKELTHDED